MGRVRGAAAVDVGSRGGQVIVCLSVPLVVAVVCAQMYACVRLSVCLSAGLFPVDVCVRACLPPCLCLCLFVFGPVCVCACALCCT